MLKIYLKDSDVPRLADERIRIVREEAPREPCDNEDLVFERVFDESEIPTNALFMWDFQPIGKDRMFFFTTELRCKEFVSPKPEDWTFDKLKKFAEEEKKLYQDWDQCCVYGWIQEKWNPVQRKWDTVSSTYGYYGAEALLAELKDKTIPVCIDSEDLKYDFDNTEKKVNELE